MHVVDAETAIDSIKTGSAVAVSGGGYRVVPERLLETLERRYVTQGAPGSLTILSVGNLERSRAGKGGSGTGLNRFAHPGFASTIISGSYSRSRNSEINRAIANDELTAYNLPMGTMVQWLRAIGTGEPGLVTSVGFGTFVDPRQEAGRMNRVTRHALSEVIDISGRAVLFYPRMRVDVALVKGTSADDRGNIFIDREAYSHGLYYTALAAKNSRGMVIAQVNRLVKRHEIHPRLGKIPGPMVDLVVVDEDVWEDEQDPRLSGQETAVLAPQEVDPIRALIARRVLAEIPRGASVNLGAGIPMYHLADVARSVGRLDLYFTLEQGGMGGDPMVGGVTRNPEVMLDSLEVFDYYQGGGPDVGCLGFAQFDRHCNVNVSRFDSIAVGCGGFIDIVHGIRRLVFCGTFTSGGLQAKLSGGRLSIDKEGRYKRLVDKVEQITFNGQEAIARGSHVTIVTERAVFDVLPGRIRLREITPGIDVERDILALADVPIEVDSELQVLNSAVLSGL